MPASLSLYDRLGGLYGIAAAVDVLVERLYDNAPALVGRHAPALRDRKARAGLVHVLTAWSVEQTGGPACYRGRDAHESLAHLSVSEHEFDVLEREVVTALASAGVPRQEQSELVDILESYRWMVVQPREALSA